MCMSAKTEAVKAYFDAWDSRDTDAILNTLTADGTYSDPFGGENLSGQAYADYANTLFTAFPDLKLELISTPWRVMAWSQPPGCCLAPMRGRLETSLQRSVKSVCPAAILLQLRMARLKK